MSAESRSKPRRGRIWKGNVNLSSLVMIHFSYFGSDVLDDIRNHIVQNYLGEAPLYTSFVIETRHPTCKYLIYTAAFLASGMTNSFNSYSATWSAIMAVRTLSLDKSKGILRFCSKGFWTIEEGKYYLMVTNRKGQVMKNPRDKCISHFSMC